MKSETMTAATEDYLEAILILAKAKGSARSVDIAALLDVSKPAVHKATHTLKALGLITQEPYGGLALTEAGRSIASKVLRRHNIIKEFLIDHLGVSAETAEIDACKIEHNISTETLKAIKLKLMFHENGVN